MLQRIQSIYLLVSSILMTATLYVPFMIFQTGGYIISINAFKIEDSNAALLSESASIQTIGIAIILVAVLSFAAIFFFKKRLFQMRIVRYTMIIKLALIAVIAYFMYLIINGADVHVAVKPQLASLLLVIAIFVEWLALKAIKKDEELVRSVDRIR